MPEAKEPSPTRIALEESILHWKEIAANPLKLAFGREECALCTIYWLDAEESTACVGCPVMCRSGVKHCHHTPYANFAHLRLELEDNIKDDLPCNAEEIEDLTFVLPMQPPSPKRRHRQ